MPRRILVVDDEPPIHELVAEYLRGRGMEVEVARDGREARALLAGGAFDLVLTDLKLPDTDGIELVKTAARTVPPTPSLIMTGYGTVESAVIALRSGAQDYVLKPFRLRDIHAAIEGALERTRAAREGVHHGAALSLFERAELAQTPGDVMELLPLLCDLVALAPGVERVAVTHRGQVAYASAGGPPDPGVAEPFDLGGDWALEHSPPSATVVAWALAVRRARARVGA
jgi:DNA-binding response OmpR family regulator